MATTKNSKGSKKNSTETNNTPVQVVAAPAPVTSLVSDKKNKPESKAKAAPVLVLDRESLLEKALKSGAILRTTDAYKKGKFKVGDAVVSENGVLGHIKEELDGRPMKIEINCLVCNASRVVHSQDFFQAVTCLKSVNKECAKTLKKSTFKKVPVNHGDGTPGNSIASDMKLLEEALANNLISQETYRSKKVELDERKKAQEAEKKVKRAEKVKVSKTAKLTTRLVERLGIKVNLPAVPAASGPVQAAAKTENTEKVEVSVDQDDDFLQSVMSKE